MKKYLVIAAVIAAIAAILLVGVVWYPFIQRYRVNAHLSNAKVYQQGRQWQRMEAELRQAIELRPDYEDAWRMLAWNYCYNVRADFDNVEEKYSTIKRGIEVAIEATDRNPKSSRLPWDVGWCFFHAIGKSDESEQLRRLVAQDIEFHDLLRKYVDLDAAEGLDGQPDSFLLAKLWFDKAAETADQFGLADGWMGPPAFYSYSAHSQTSFAIGNQAEGATGEPVARAWQMAEKAWQEYANRPFTYAEGKTIRLNDRDAAAAQKEELLRQQNYCSAYPGELDKKMREAEEKLYWASRFRLMINFDYWPDRCRMEQTNEMLSLRRLMYESREHAAKSHQSDENRQEAQRLFERAFALWTQVLNDDTTFAKDDLTTEEIAQFIMLYQSNVLDGQPLPNDLPLRDIVTRYESWQTETQRMIDVNREFSRKKQGR